MSKISESFLQKMNDKTTDTKKGRPVKNRSIGHYILGLNIN